ncbi:hypothetical protein ACJJTC_014474 [Scirpophaga incertulas]
MFITLPRSDEDIRKSQEEFYKIARFPRVISAIDGPISEFSHLVETQQRNLGTEKAFFLLMCKQCPVPYYTTWQEKKNEDEPPEDPEVDVPPQPIFPPSIANPTSAERLQTRNIMLSYFQSLINT